MHKCHTQSHVPREGTSFLEVIRIEWAHTTHVQVLGLGEPRERVGALSPPSRHTWQNQT